MNPKYPTTQLPNHPNSQPTSHPAAAPALICDPAAIAASLKAHVDALAADANALTPLLGFALTNLRGALSALQGHNQASAAALKADK